MRRTGFFIALALAGRAVVAAAPRAQRPAAETCATPFRVVERSFKRLNARNAAVWVDDIRSNFRRGYAPFAVTVVVGGAYPPFAADEGRLERQAFESLIKRAYGVARTNLTVSEALVKSGAAASFTSARLAFVLRVVSVSTSLTGEDAVTFKLCR